MCSPTSRTRRRHPLGTRCTTLSTWLIDETEEQSESSRCGSTETELCLFSSLSSTSRNGRISAPGSSVPLVSSYSLIGFATALLLPSSSSFSFFLNDKVTATRVTEEQRKWKVSYCAHQFIRISLGRLNAKNQGPHPSSAASLSR